VNSEVEEMQAMFTPAKSRMEHYPRWSVVTGVLLTANPSVYTAVRKSIAHWWRQKEMIQPHPLV
jgi:hypothetical protein